MNKSSLPESWKIVKVDSVGNLFRGISYKKNDATLEPHKGYLPILRANNINGELNFDDLVYVPSKYVEDRQVVKKGDIIIAMSSGSKKLVGKSAKAKNDFSGSYGAFCAMFRPTESVSKDFVALFFNGPSYRRLISEIAKGTNINNLKREHILDLDFPLPPLREQYRIVEKTEALFSELENGIEQLKTAQQQLKVYRQSVLKSAFEGKLTSEWRKSQISRQKDGGQANPKSQITGMAAEPTVTYRPASAKELLERIKQEREAQAKESGKKLKPIAPLTEKELAELPELPEGWSWVRLYEVAESSLGKMLDQQKNKGTLLPYLRNINVRWGSFDVGNLAEMRVEDSESDRFGVKYGDLIVCEGGEPGRCAIWRNQVPNMKIQKALHRVRFINAVKAEYFFYFMLLSGMSDTLEKYFTGTTIKHLTGESLNQFPMPVCSPAEQHQIVQEIETRLSVCDKLEETITASLHQSEALRQSILKKAFEGKLVEQDPKDEPAGALLERIRAGKKVEPKAKKKDPSKAG